nr:NADAR family protein [Nocardia jejuensis]
MFADGVIRCGESFDLPGLQRRLHSGKVALSDPGRPLPEQPEQTPRWSARYPEPLTHNGFLGEIRDEISMLNGRPTTSDLCREAIGRYRGAPTEANRLLVKDAYLTIPAHLRVFVLGDMDRQDIPLRQLVTELGKPVGGDGPIATVEMHRLVLEYFEASHRGIQHSGDRLARLHADDPATPRTATITLHERGGPPVEPPATLDLFVLRNEFPAPLSYAGETYPTVLHGYWALAAHDRDDHDRVRDAPTVYAAHEIGGSCVLRSDWSLARTAVMAGLLRAKFTQHLELAEILRSTADAPISYTGYSESPFWTDQGRDEGRNWVGRLLELVRSELSATTIHHLPADRS